MIRPERLLDQAETLIADGTARAPEENLRRAISAAYYALFHQCLAAAADVLLGEAARAPDLYGLAYRSVDHRRLRDLCTEYTRPQRSKRYAKHLTPGDLDQDLVAYAVRVLDLYESRASADYDPTWTVSAEDASAALDVARSAFGRFIAADPGKRRRFLILLHFPPR